MAEIEHLNPDLPEGAIPTSAAAKKWKEAVALIAHDDLSDQPWSDNVKHGYWLAQRDLRDLLGETEAMCAFDCGALPDECPHHPRCLFPAPAQQGEDAAREVLEETVEQARAMVR